MRHLVDWQFERGDETLEVAIVYDIEPYVRAQIYGPSEDCYPAEGGCVTYLEANVELTAEERAEVVQWIEQNHDHEEDRDDAAYDAWRDDEMDRTSRDLAEDW